MSLLTKISQLFSKNSSSQQIGIAFQQQGVSLCLIPEQKGTDSEAKNSSAKVLFQQEKATVTSYVKAINKLYENELEGTVNLVLSEAQSQIVQVDKPTMPEAEINGALKWQIKDLVSIAPENMILDYYDAPTLAGGKEKINVVCAPLNELKSLVNVVEENGTKVASITTQEFAFANLLPFQNDAVLLVCQQPNEEIVLIIVKRKQIFFHRRLRGFSQISTKTIQELSSGMIDDISLEIQRSTDYFERQLKQAPIKAIKVLLPIDLENDFIELLSNNTLVPVSPLDLPRPYHQHRDFAAAIGGCIDEITHENTDNDSVGEDHER